MLNNRATYHKYYCIVINCGLTFEHGEYGWLVLRGSSIDLSLKYCYSYSYI